MMNVSSVSGGSKMKRKIVLILTLILMLLVGACSGPGGFKADHHYEIQPFTYTNQHNKSVSLDDLTGTVWIGQFIFTNCTTVCLPMMSNMTKLQDMLQEEGITDYKIVSFSVDPANDTPEALQSYLTEFGVADESKWEMLTGYKQEEIAQLAAKSFKTLVADIPDSDQVMHGVSFSLVNKEGQVVKTYNGAEDVQFDQIVKDMKALIRMEPTK